MKMFSYRILAVFFVLASCSQHQVRYSDDDVQQQSVKPIIISATQPFIVKMDSVEPPMVQPCNLYRKEKEKPGKVLFTRLFINYTTENGLPVNSFTSSMTDLSGHLWLGSNGAGVIRFDGKVFKQFTTANGLSNNGIWQMAQDNKGAVWFATYGGGLNRYDGKKFSSWQKQDGLSSNGIFSLSLHNDQIWLGTVESGACVFNTKTEKANVDVPEMNDKTVKYVDVDASGTVWMGNASGLFKKNESGFSHPGITEGIQEGPCTCLLSDKNKVWFGIKNSGLYCYDGNNYKNFTVSDGLSGMTVTAMHTDRKGNLWIATDKGLNVLDNDGFTGFGIDEGLPQSTITSITSDKYGVIWLTTDGEGVFKYEGTEYRMVDKDKMLDGHSVHTMCQDHNGNVWMGTIGGGVYRYSQGELRRITTADGLVSDDIWSMAEDSDGNMWFGSLKSGVSKFNGKSFENYSVLQGLSNNMVRSVSCSADGSVWLGTTGGGVNHIKGNVIEQYHTSQGLCSEIILCVFEDHKGNMWFGSVGQGLCRFDGKSFTTYTEANGLANNIVIAIHEDRHHNIWAATEGGGISRYDGKTWISFSSDNGLPDNTVYGIDEDKENQIWIGSNEGLSKLIFRDEKYATVDADNHLTNEQLKKLFLIPKNYTRKTGYPFKDMNSGQHALLIDSSGLIWAGTADNHYGLICIREKRNQITAPSKVRLQSIALEGKPVSWYQLKAATLKKNEADTLAAMINNEEMVSFGRKHDFAERKKMSESLKSVMFEDITADYPVPGDLSIPYQLNDVSFSFASVEPAFQQIVEYRYKLPGYADEWSLPSQSGYARFGNIHEGTYDFLVSSRFNQGQWGPETSYHFVVRPPWYRTGWMYLIYFLFLAGIVFGYNRWKVYRLLHANRLLEEKVKQRTHEVVKEKENVEKEKKKSDELLLNILPEETANELKQFGFSKPRRHEQVTIMFTDFKNFTRACENMTPQEMVEIINHCYSNFDKIISKHGLEKIKTIGDSYMCASGIPASNPEHAVCCARAALEIRDFMREEKRKRESEKKNFFEIRIGLHSGPVVAGIVGTKKFAYDIWGDSVNTASRMESSGATGMVNVSEETCQLIKNEFECTPRGEIEAKNKSKLKMYFIEWKSV